jgi:hypothetical protein
VGLLSRRVYDYCVRFPVRRCPDLTDDVAVAGDVEQRVMRSSRQSSTTARTRVCSIRYLAGEDIGSGMCSSTTWKQRLRAGTFYPGRRPVCSGTGLGLGETVGDHQRRLPVAVELDPPAVTHRNREHGQTDPVTTMPDRCGRGHPYLVDPYRAGCPSSRIFSGTLSPDSANPCLGTRGRVRAGHSDHDTDERVGQLLLTVRLHFASIDKGGCR